VGKVRAKNKARSEWWKIHIEAWQRSGISRRRYCRQQRLCETTFTRWLRTLADAEALKIKPEMKREKRTEEARRRHVPLMPELRSRAARAFWAMHVEALRWSGMPLRSYAKALLISPYNLRKWRDSLDSGEEVVDWRAALHPSARANLSTSAKHSATESAAESGLTSSSDAPRAAAKKQARRSFSADEKLAIVLETERPGETVSAVARRHDIVASLLFRWRDELGFGKDKTPKLARVKLAGGRAAGGAAAVVLDDLIPVPDGMVAVELDDGRRVFVPAGSDRRAVQEQVARQENGQC
jgi:hypothetical protein